MLSHSYDMIHSLAHLFVGNALIFKLPVTSTTNYCIVQLLTNKYLLLIVSISTKYGLVLANIVTHSEVLHSLSMGCALAMVYTYVRRDRAVSEHIRNNICYSKKTPVYVCVSKFL